VSRGVLLASAASPPSASRTAALTSRRYLYKDRASFVRSSPLPLSCCSSPPRRGASPLARRFAAPRYAAAAACKHERQTVRFAEDKREIFIFHLIQ
jgi:hypothetical protein